MSETIEVVKPGSDPFQIAVQKMKDQGDILKNEGFNACYGGVSKSQSAGYGWGCHVKMAHLPVGTEVVWSSWTPPKSESADAFFDWITSDSSPWKIAFDMGMSFQDKNYFNREFWKSQGFIFDNLKKIPSNVLQNFLIATRIPKQHPKLCNIWNELVKNGLTPEMALILASNFPFGPTRAGRKIQSCYSDQGDYPLYVVSGNGQYVRNFIEHRMDESRFNPPYFERHVYIPVNALWGNSHEPHRYGVHADRINSIRTDKSWLGNYSDKIGTKSITPAGFGDKMYVSWACDIKELTEIGHLEMKRMGYT